MIVGEREGIGAESVPHGGHAQALELTLHFVPQLREPALGLDLLLGLDGGDALDAALLLAAQPQAMPRPPVLLTVSFSSCQGDYEG